MSLSRYDVMKADINHFFVHGWNSLKKWTLEKSKSRIGRGLTSVGTGASLSLAVYFVCNLIFPPSTLITALTVILTGVTFTGVTILKFNRLSRELDKTDETEKIELLEIHIESLVDDQNHNNELILQQMSQLVHATETLATDFCEEKNSGRGKYEKILAPLRGDVVPLQKFALKIPPPELKSTPPPLKKMNAAPAFLAEIKTSSHPSKPVYYGALGSDSLPAQHRCVAAKSDESSSLLSHSFFKSLAPTQPKLKAQLARPKKPKKERNDCEELNTAFAKMTLNST